MYNEKTFILAVLLVLQNNFPPMIVYLLDEIVSLVHNPGCDFPKILDRGFIKMQIPLKILGSILAISWLCHSRGSLGRFV